MNDKVKELEEFKSNLEAMQRFHGPVLDREKEIARDLDKLVEKTVRRYREVAEICNEKDRDQCI